MKTYQLIRNLKNTWVNEDQAAKIFNVSTEDMSYFLWLGGGSEIPHRWQDQNEPPEYRLYEIAQAIGSECQKLNNQNLWLKVALLVVSIILAIAVLYASIY